MSLIKMSVSGAVVILVIIAIRAAAINRLPKKTFSALWFIALARLLIPYSLPSPFSVYSLFVGTALPAKAEALGNGVPAVTSHPMPRADTALSAPEVSADSPAPNPIMLIWLIGALLCAVFFAAAYLRYRREFRESLPVDTGFASDWLKSHPLRRTVRIRQSDRISAPLTYGVFRPVILLPKRADREDEATLSYVLTHEYVHIRRFDALAKLAPVVALCVHWFNPAVWVLYILANRDMELSCDEAVIRLLGERTKSAYAMALIRMEEARSKFRPLCSNFSKYAIKERIVAIMKIKKTSPAALFAAVGLIAGVAATCATSVQAAATSGVGNNDAADSFQTAVNDRTVMSYTDPSDGKTYYSTDEGEAWTPMADEEFTAASGLDDVEWWTEEEYAAWLEQEKLALQSVVGEKCWNPTDGWYTWTQELADETIAMYEQTLRDIQSGHKISKPTADGDTMIQYGYDPDLQMAADDATTVVGSVAVMDDFAGNAVTADSGQALTSELLAAYKDYGLTYDESKDAFYFNGKPVRYLFDGYTLENGVATVYEHLNKDGVVDVHIVRQATRTPTAAPTPAAGSWVLWRTAGRNLTAASL